MSDEFSFGPALAANPMALEKGLRNIAMAASLAHNVSFLNPLVKVDEWIVLERKTSWGAEGRVLVSQQIWSLETGRLVMSGTQEALI
jgi:acyl-CoA thioesterase-2